MEIVAYSSAEHREAVERLNARLAAGGTEFSFPREAPSAAREGVWFEHMVAAEEGQIYGGYLLKHQKFFVHGDAVDLDNMQLPLSLGLIDNRFAHVSAALLFDALGRNDLLYCLGMGSQESKLVKMLTAAGWRHRVVPFYFSVKSANRFARNIRLPAGKKWTQRGLRVLGHLRLAGIGLSAHALLRGKKCAQAAEAEATSVPRFEAWADELFDQHGASYALIGDRRAQTLNGWYPESNPKFIRLMFKTAGRTAGWALLLDTQMQNHKYFGNLRVGTLADCFAAPEHAATIVAAADQHLTRRGVDLVVSNQLHPAWTDALEQAGYRQGPSNFFFYFSSTLAERLEARPGWAHGLHINRGDGDGPIHL